MINWDITKADSALIDAIVARAASLSPGIDRLTLSMDLTACHLNGCPLKLAELSGAEEFDFWHDLGGIARHIDRSTGKLGGCFLPRFAAKEETMNFDSVEFTIAGHWLSAMFNGDYTGLSDSEARQLDSFIASETRGLPAGHWAGGAEEDGAGFSTDEVSGMLADCYRVQYCYPIA